MKIIAPINKKIIFIDSDSLTIIDSDNVNIFE